MVQVATDRVQKEFNLLNEKVQKLHHDLEDQIHTNTQLLAENGSKALELKQKEDEISQVKVSLKQYLHIWLEKQCVGCFPDLYMHKCCFDCSLALLSI